ncbi:MAG: hypothetical protein ACMUIP_05015 [bacterium]
MHITNAPLDHQAFRLYNGGNCILALNYLVKNHFHKKSGVTVDAPI